MIIRNIIEKLMGFQGQLYQLIVLKQLFLVKLKPSKKALLRLKKIMKNKKIITATLLVSDGPVQNSYFEELLEIDGNKLFKLFDEINNDLTNLGFGFYLRFDSTKSDLVTVNDIPKYLDSVKPPSVLKGLSTPALETLAIIAYEQPVTKLKVSEIRGVESESSIKTLESRGLVYKSGELDVPGSPILYSTTDEFLEKTGFESLNDLPTIGEYFSSPSEEE